MFSSNKGKKKSFNTEDIESVDSHSDFDSFPASTFPSKKKTKMISDIDYEALSPAEKIKQTAVDLEVIAAQKRKQRVTNRYLTREKKKEDTKQQLLEFRIVRESQNIIEDQKRIMAKNAAVSPVKVEPMSEALLRDITSKQGNTISPQASESSSASVPTPSPSTTNNVARFDHVRGRDLFGPGRFCSACGHIYGRFGIKCAELQYRDICLQTVIDYIEGVGGVKKADEIGVSLAYTNAFVAAVKQDILIVTGKYEMNNVNPWPKCIDEGSYTQAFQLLEHPDLLECMYRKRSVNVWDWLDAGENEAARKKRGNS